MLMQPSSCFNWGQLSRPWYMVCFLFYYILSANGQSRIWYVKADSSTANDGTSWQTACSMGKALSSAQAGDKVWARQGTYYLYRSEQVPLDERQQYSKIYFRIPSGVKVYGRFAGDETQLTQRHGGESELTSYFSSHTVVFKNAEPGTLLDGFKLTGNDALYSVGGTNQEEFGAADAIGGVILNFASGSTSNPTINNCILADGGGGTFRGGALVGNWADQNGRADIRLLNCLLGAEHGGYDCYTRQSAVANYQVSGQAHLLMYNCQMKFLGITDGDVNALGLTTDRRTLIYNSADANSSCRVINCSIYQNHLAGCNPRARQDPFYLVSCHRGITAYMVNCYVTDNFNFSQNMGIEVPPVGFTENVDLSYCVMKDVPNVAGVAYAAGGVSPVYGCPTDPSRHLYNLADGPPPALPCNSYLTDAGDPTLLQRWSDLADIPGLAQRIVNHIDIGPAETDRTYPHSRYYVNPTATGKGDGTSWQDAFANLNYALTQANLCGIEELWVAQGTYQAPSPGSFSFREAITYYGGFAGTETSLDQRDIQAHPTILSSASTAAPIIKCQNLTPATRLDGFVIQGGNTSSGGGMYNQNSSPTLANCSFQNNTASQNGGGLFNDETSHPILLNCSFSGNKAGNGGAIYISSSSSLTITGTSFSQNTATVGGGALFSDSSNPMLTGCNFTQNMANKGGAIYTNNVGGPTLINTQFIRNAAANQGGALFSTGANINSILVRLINCTLVANQASQGGAFHNTLSRVSLMNCSLSGNSASTQGGSFYNLTSPVELTNSVVWNSGGGNSFVNSLGGSVTASYSLFEASVTGYTSSTTNLTTNSLPFVSATDLQLGLNSPAINKGSNTAYSNAGGIPTDIAGMRRILGGTIDMGAFEVTPDLTPLIYARPNLGYGPTDISLVVDVVELKGISTDGLITVKLTKDARLSLDFSPVTTSINNRPVQNRVWSFTNSDPAYYILTTSQPVEAGDKLSFGITGWLSPGATRGVMTVGAVILGSSVSEANATNNIDADKLEYFPQ